MFITKADHQPQKVRHGDAVGWSCGKNTCSGDSVLVYVASTGVCYEWRATSDAKKDRRWDYVCNVEYVRSFEPPITIQELRVAAPKSVWSPPHQNFRGHSSIAIPSRIFRRIKALRFGRSFVDIEREFDQKVKQSFALTAEQRRKRLASASRKHGKLRSWPRCL